MDKRFVCSALFTAGALLDSVLIANIKVDHIFQRYGGENVRKRTFKEIIEEHDKQIAWQKSVIREEAREAANNEVKKDK